MGANVSKQLVDLTEKSVTDIAIEFTQQNTSVINNTQEVEIVDVEGNVEIGELNLEQQVEIDVKQSMASLSNNTAQLKLVDKILQESKQVVSGLNLAQANYAEENMQKFVEAIYKFSSAVAQRCAATAQQKQRVKVRGVGGSLRLKRLLMTQVLGLASECVQDTALASTSLVEMETDISQRTDQLAEGLSPFALLGLLALGAVGVPLVAGGVALTVLGPLLIAAGAGVIGWSVLAKRTTVKLKMFSGLYGDAPGRVDVSANFYTEAVEPTLDFVVRAFERHDAYAFDLDRCSRKVFMYTDPSVLSVTPATQDLAVYPALIADKASMRNGDVHIDENTGKLVRKCAANYLLVKQLDKNETYRLEGFKLIKTSTGAEESIPRWPNLINVSGWKETSVDKTILISGVVCLTAGIFLLIMQKINPRGEKKS